MSEKVILHQNHQDYIDLIQFTDTHIFADEDKTFDGINTMKSLQRVIVNAKASTWPPDAVLMTGDLVHDPVPVAYERLLTNISEIEVPVFCLPGNHDQPELMRQMLTAGNISVQKSVLFYDWIIIMLDSFLANTHAGHLAEEEICFLDRILNDNEDKYALICLHHPPVPTESAWMDEMLLDNPENLFSVIDNYSRVRAILWGHIHQEFISQRNDVLLLASPSTCVQFKPKRKLYSKDNLTAGYRRLMLFSTGEIKTEVKRI